MTAASAESVIPRGEPEGRASKDVLRLSKDVVLRLSKDVPS
jgi:hypothetical protein